MSAAKMMMSRYSTTACCTGLRGRASADGRRRSQACCLAEDCAAQSRGSSMQAVRVQRGPSSGAPESRPRRHPPGAGVRRKGHDVGLIPDREGHGHDRDPPPAAVPACAARWVARGLPTPLRQSWAPARAARPCSRAPPISARAHLQSRGCTTPGGRFCWTIATWLGDIRIACAMRHERTCWRQPRGGRRAGCTPVSAGQCPGEGRAGQRATKRCKLTYQIIPGDLTDDTARLGFFFFFAACCGDVLPPPLPAPTADMALSNAYLSESDTREAAADIPSRWRVSDGASMAAAGPAAAVASDWGRSDGPVCSESG
jgi:hypothetical protein